MPEQPSSCEDGATEADLTKLLALELCDPAATEVALADLEMKNITETEHWPWRHKPGGRGVSSRGSIAGVDTSGRAVPATHFTVLIRVR